MFLIKHFVASSLHLGHSTNHWNPRTAYYILAAYQRGKGEIHIIDIEQTILMLRRAFNFLSNIKRDGFILLPLRDLANDIDLSPLGINSTLDDLKIIFRHNTFKLFPCRLDRGSCSTMGPDRLENPTRGALFVLKIKTQMPLIKEAQKCGINVVGVVNTNSYIGGIQYPIPGNNKTREAINMYIKLLAKLLFKCHT